MGFSVFNLFYAEISFRANQNQRVGLAVNQIAQERKSVFMTMCYELLLLVGMFDEVLKRNDFVDLGLESLVTLFGGRNNDFFYALCL